VYVCVTRFGGGQSVFVRPVRPGRLILPLASFSSFLLRIRVLGVLLVLFLNGETA